MFETLVNFVAHGKDFPLNVILQQVLREIPISMTLFYQTYEA